MPEGLNQNFSVSTGPLPASRKAYVPGKQHPQIRVPLREIDLSPAAKEPAVRVYDASGPYTDPTATTKTKSKTFIFESVRLPDTRSTTISARKPRKARVADRPRLYQPLKKNGA